MKEIAVIALVDTNELGEATKNIVPFLIVTAIVAIIGAIVLIRFGGSLIRRAAATSGGRNVLQIIVVAVFALGGFLYLATAVSYDVKSIGIIGLIAAVSLPALVVVIRLLDEPEDAVVDQFDSEER